MNDDTFLEIIDFGIKTKSYYEPVTKWNNAREDSTFQIREVQVVNQDSNTHNLYEVSENYGSRHEIGYVSDQWTEDETVWCDNLEDTLWYKSKNKTSDGGKTDYYDVFTGCTDVDSFCAKNNLSFFEGNVLKALVGVVKGKSNGEPRHKGTSVLRDLKKMRFYVNKMLEEYEGEEK